MTQPPAQGTKASPFWGTGRRKTAIARVRLLTGSGKVLINDREVDKYFTEEKDRNSARSPLIATNQLTTYDVFARVEGGGSSGQADAVKLGIARALLKADPALDAALRAGGFMTRDPRMKERKKYGQKGARKRFQFSKR